MSVPYFLDPVAPSRGPRWLNRWLPSKRLRTDPLQGLSVEGRYAPVSIANWKLIPSVARTLLAGRVIAPAVLRGRPPAHGRRAVPRPRAASARNCVPALSAMLREQGVRRRIVVVEQQAGQPFNRGRLLNIGMQLTADATDYYCLHDVDAVPVVANYALPVAAAAPGDEIIGMAGRSVPAQWPLLLRRRVDPQGSGVRRQWLFQRILGLGQGGRRFSSSGCCSLASCATSTARHLPRPAESVHHRCSAAALGAVTCSNRQRRSLLLRGWRIPPTTGSTRCTSGARRATPSTADYENIRVRW